MQGALEAELVRREVERRQQFLDGLLVADRERKQAQDDADRQRQVRLDQQRENEYLRSVSVEDVDRANRQERQRIDDARYEADQRQKVLDREDANAQRYVSSERDLFEADKRRQFEASEAAKQRANARYVVDKQMAGSGKKTDTPTEHNPSRLTIDALDELSERINTAEGAAARLSGSWKAAQATAGYEDDYNEYEAVLNGAIPLIARRLGHTGVLTQADVDSVKSMFPRPGDNKSLRDRKMTRIRSLMNEPGGSGTGSGNGGNARVRRYNPATGKIE
jgi:hypothetical protein